MKNLTKNILISFVGFALYLVARIIVVHTFHLPMGHLEDRIIDNLSGVFSILLTYVLPVSLFFNFVSLFKKKPVYATEARIVYIDKQREARRGGG